MLYERPLVLFTNDDGIASPGLWAAVDAFCDWADVLVVAPHEQQSGTGRSMPITSKGRIYPAVRRLDGRDAMIADLVAIVGSVDVVLGDCDR